MNLTLRLKRHPFRYACLATLIFSIAFFFVGWPTETPGVEYGITWSKPYAESLGLESQAGLERVLDDLGVRRVRLPAYWNLIETERDKFDFAWLDSEIEAVSERQGSVILAVGSRLPRWPECWEPEWTRGLSQDERQREQLAYVRQVYDRYADNPTIIAWQVENEATLMLYRKCEGLTKELIREEMKLLRGFERRRPAYLRRQVVTSDSGEFSSWLSFAGYVDGKAVSVYRVVVNPIIGIWRHTLVPPWFYARKALIARLFFNDVYVGEFQMEPWADLPLTSLTDDEMGKTFDLKQMKENLWYAKRLGMDRVDFWGAEWWLWMKEKHGRSEFWNAAKAFLTNP